MTLPPVVLLCVSVVHCVGVSFPSRNGRMHSDSVSTHIAPQRIVTIANDKKGSAASTTRRSGYKVCQYCAGCVCVCHRALISFLLLTESTFRSRRNQHKNTETTNKINLIQKRLGLAVIGPYPPVPSILLVVSSLSLPQPLLLHDG